MRLANLRDRAIVEWDEQERELAGYGRDASNAAMRELGVTDMVEPKRVSRGLRRRRAETLPVGGQLLHQVRSRSLLPRARKPWGADARPQAGSMSDESAQDRALLPFLQQLDTDGRLHDIAPEHERVRLF
jgi:hypothetical protein